MNQCKLLTGLFESQRLAVLATENTGEPYNCLIAFAFSEDLKYLFFATRRDTRKFQDITRNPKVAMLIDNRSNEEADFKDAIAVTVKGTARELTSRERDQLGTLYLARHPYLASFITDDNVALLEIAVVEYLIARFDSTEVIHPS